ncbi:MAG: chlorophyll synthesis pathway protein BchC [Rubrivivax sp.]|jgi:3-hydroxyethyl bacteriochlorophyllide a dehydrogenase|nr:chlorophyll synthesis pathway protein BchC [Rubrivivax sp.]
MKTAAVVMQAPQELVVDELELDAAGANDLIVDIEWSGISTGTEKLLWTGRMPTFPGMGYPLVPGYESVGQVVAAGPGARHRVGDRVFVPGARCFGPVRGLFGGAAARLVVGDERVYNVDAALGESAVLLALAATAYHAVSGGGKRQPVNAPDLIIGHGVLGRLLARLTVAAGLPPPTVWELDPVRSEGARGYEVIGPDSDKRRDYRAVYDVSGDVRIIDKAMPHLAKGGEIVLAGFYADPLSFDFAPAFTREASVRAAAEWQRADMLAVRQLTDEGRLDLTGLITHRERAEHARGAYRTAFSDAACLKMVLDWKGCQ